MIKKLIISFPILVFLFIPKEALAVSFNISNPAVIENTVTFDAVISDLSSNSCPSSKCYLQGALKKEDKNNYFGLTKNNSGEWISYVSNTQKNYITQKFLYCEVLNNECKTQVSMKFNHDDPYYYGVGNYSLKLKRYSGESDSDSGESNVLTIALNVATPTPSPTPTPTSTPTPSPSPSPTTTGTPTPTASPKPTPTPTVKSSPSMGPVETPKTTPFSLGDPTSTPTVLGETDVLNDGFNLPLPAIALIAGGLASMGIAGFSILKNKNKDDQN